MGEGGRTDLPSLEEQVEILKEQLFQAQKMTALGELVSTTTHEFNNVLMTIINYAKIGLRHKDEATRDKAFEKIHAAGNRAAKITNGVLGIARNRSDSREPTDLVKLVQDTMILLERELHKHRVSVDTYLENVPPIYVCGNQIQQVVLNLLINARQAMPSGGRIVIRTGLDEAEKMVDLTIRDTGTGIPEEKLVQIFDRFYSTKKGPDATGKGGTGLGLAMCRDIVESHMGRIRVQSTVGKGTAFTIRLPATRPELTQPQVAVAQPLGVPDRRVAPTN